jgi:hypothetical protein
MRKWIITKSRTANQAESERLGEEGWEPFAVADGYIYWRKG